MAPAGSRCTPRSQLARRDRRPGRDDRRDPARRRSLVPVEDLLRRLDAPVRLPRARSSARPSATCSRRKREAGEIPPLVTVQTHFRVRDAVALLHEHRVSQLPVVSAHDPTTIVGAIGERGLLKHAAEDPALLDAEIVEVMEPPFPAVSANDPVREAVDAARRRPAGAARDAGRPRRGNRHAHRPARSARQVSDAERRDAFAHSRGPRGPDAGPVLRLCDPGDPPDVDIRARTAG